MTRPSIAIPETPAHRVALSQQIRSATGLDEALIERLVRNFYGAARQDALIGPIFDVVDDWDAHIATITRFWCSVVLMNGEYHGQPMPAHARLGLEPAHFQRWLALFAATARATCPPQAVPLLMEKAQRIAQSLALGADVARGQLPPHKS